MSLAQSHGKKGVEGWTSPRIKRSEQRPRMLLKPDAHFDEETLDSPTAKRASPFSSPHGNAKPQEPAHLELRRSGSRLKPRMAMHDHPRPWTSTPQAGKRENAHLSNAMHRAWLTDQGRQGRWNKARKNEFYTAQDNLLFSLKPADEKFAVGANAKFWTHLLNNGSKRGGQEKLVYVPERSTGLHLKHNLYEGKYENVRHKQMLCCGKTTSHNSKNPDWEIDTRLMFDNRLKDDNIRMNHEEFKAALQGSYDIFRPKNTRSCPQLGADYMNR